MATKSTISAKRNAPKSPAKPAPIAAPKVPDVAPIAPEVAQAAEVSPDAAGPAPVARKPRKDAASKDAASKVSELRIALLELEGGTQSRASLSKATITEYSEQMTGGAKFPPVVAFFDGEAHWLADGFHRVHASIAIGRKKIACEVHEGSQRDAILFSASSNATHGLRRTNADKWHAVTLLLADAEWSKKADRWIADACGVSAPFIAKVRETSPTVNGLQLNPSPEGSPTVNGLQLREGRDGKERKLPAKPKEPTAVASAAPIALAVASVSTDEASALAHLESTLSTAFSAWTYAPEDFAAMLEQFASKARAQSIKAASNA